MSNSQEQSLNENAVFLPVDESSPEFLHCEKEREAVERLLSGGPEAFYSSVSSEHAACFLSPEEVSQIRSWTQNYHVKELQVEEQNGVENSFETEDFCSTYSPCHSDTPIPNLELGWPEKPPTEKIVEVAVHTSPPLEGEPPVREIIRRYLQNATQAIGVVTDKLTDNAIIGDLHMAASRGVPVYIVLNQRSLQENFTLNKLRHPNMRVRFLRGKTFCSRNGRMVVGEMKVNFLLVDLETVIHGSYSLTWTDAHLHQQLVTVLRGPVVDSFDREFRILYAASAPAPAPDTLRVTPNSQLSMPYHKPRDFSDVRFLKQVMVEPDMTNPPSPPPDVLLDWEAMGVVHRDNCSSKSHFVFNEEIGTENTPQQINNTDRAVMETLTYNGHLFEDKERINENTFETKARLEDNLPTSTHSESSSNTSSAERIMRMERKVEKRISKDLSEEKDTNLSEKTRTRVDKTLETVASAERRHFSKCDAFLEEESLNNAAPEENKYSSSKPVILKVSNTDGLSSLSAIMMRIKRGTSGMLRRGVKSTMSDRAQSMMDLSEFNEEKGVPAPRFPGNLDLDHMTPALALMRKRNNEVKSSMNRPLKNFRHLERTHSSNHINEILPWRSHYNKEEE